MNADSLGAWCDWAKVVARQAARIAIERTGTFAFQKKSDASVVTQADHDLQAFVLDAIAHRFPDHAVIAEESIQNAAAHADPTTARYAWILDPIDGTRNFVSGFPCVATAIALLDRGDPVIGVIHEHFTGLMYSAFRGGGAFLEDKPVRVRRPWPMSDFLVAVPSSKDELAHFALSHWGGQKDLVLRNVGVSNVHLAMVAAGQLTAAFGTQAKLWDVAAGYLLVIEAGGKISDPSGQPFTPFRIDDDRSRDYPFLAATPDLYDRFLHSLHGRTRVSDR